MSRRFLRSLLGAALVPILAGPAGAQAATDTAALVDRVFAAVNRTDAPGCTVGVDRAGEALIRRGYGMASLEARAPLTESSILESGSVAKQFTAGAVVYLAGNYYSDELDVTYRVTPADSTLAVQIGENDPETTARTGPDSFALPGGSTLRFTRTKGRIDGFLLFAGRVKNLRFARR